MRARTKRRWQQGIGYFIVAIGAWTVIYTLAHWRTIPVAFVRVREVKEVVKLVPARPPDDPHIGPTRVAHMWRVATKEFGEVPDGDYQFENSQGLIQTLHFCDQPPPLLKIGSLVEVHFQYMSNFNTDKCVRLAWVLTLENK